MAAPTEIYVDPSIAADSGSGTIGDPYGDLQYALDQTTRDSTNGNRFNVKAGTDEVLSAALDFSTYGAPTPGEPCIIQGYTSAAGDGGVGGISGNGGNFSILSNQNYVIFQSMHLHNTGTAAVLDLGPFGCGVYACEIDNSTGDGVGYYGTNGSFLIVNCHVHNIGGVGARIWSGSVLGSYFTNGTNDFSAAISLEATGREHGSASRNIISVDGSSNGIVLDGHNIAAFSNSILSSSGTGVGVASTGTQGLNGAIYNNLVEGFSGAGGIGIEVESGDDIHLYGYNGVFNCTTEYTLTGDVFVNLGDNESLASSPFAKSGSDNFANRGVYFEPQDVGNVRGGAYPTELRLDKGAVQHADPGGLLRHPGANGGLSA